MIIANRDCTEEEIQAIFDNLARIDRERYQAKASIVPHPWARVIKYSGAECSWGKPQYGYIYLMADKSRTAFKIGRSIDPKQRLRQIQRKIPFQLDLVHAVPSANAQGVEYMFHCRLFDNLVSGEWYELPDSFVEKFCEVDFFDWRGE